MRNCKKNQRKMYYALYNDSIPILDDNGFEEFETTTGYSEPVIFYASLSTGQSNAEESPFGTNVSYDRVISTADTSLPIDQNSIIWIKNKPAYHADGSINGDSADYKVAALPLDGLNSLRIAVKRTLNRVVEESMKDTNTVQDGENTGKEDGFN